MTNYYICIHGHFYQPMRADPWLEVVAPQASAYPFHDWNARIAEECYAPNAASRILDEDGRVQETVNNYARISFNFGPTLLGWLKKERPDVYRAILAADRESRERLSGHGSAVAQAYSHVILPLANQRDKRTQICWGIKDFAHHFGRYPEGMWLPEAAVDLETLDILAGEGLKFSLLSPHQAKRVCHLGTREWQAVSGGRIDSTQPYLLRLPSGRAISLFFYDAPLSQDVAFNGLLSNGDVFASRLLGAFAPQRSGPQLVHVITDGETYGHHHRHGDMALAYAIRRIESEGRVRFTNYGAFLEEHPPTHEAEIIERSSWSCAHGIERWRSDCGCNTGGHPEWNQEWRAPLREALDWIRDMLAPQYEEAARPLLRDPWVARDAYIEVVLDRSPAAWRKFLAEQGVRELSEVEKNMVIGLLELQRHAMLMYASDGWFFDEISRPETVQILRHAARVLELSRSLFEDDLEERFLERLEFARSNLPDKRDGRSVYEQMVRRNRVS